MKITAILKKGQSAEELIKLWTESSYMVVLKKISRLSTFSTHFHIERELFKETYHLS